MGQLGLSTWFNPPKTGSQSRALYGTVCALSIANSMLLINPLLVCGFLIDLEICGFFNILLHNMIIIYSLVVILATVLVQ